MMGTMLAIGAFFNLEAEITLSGQDFLPAKGPGKIEVFQAKDLALKPGSTIRIQLPLNAGTGYQWQLLGPEFGPLELSGSRTNLPMRMLPGASAVQEFEFTAKAVQRGITQQIVLVFNLRRPFEGLGARILQVRVQVGEP